LFANFPVKRFLPAAVALDAHRPRERKKDGEEEEMENAETNERPQNCPRFPLSNDILLLFFHFEVIPVMAVLPRAFGQITGRMLRLRWEYVNFN
jgi:hypothetical protein